MKFNKNLSDESEMNVREFISNTAIVYEAIGRNLHNKVTPNSTDTERRLTINNRVKIRYKYEEEDDAFHCESYAFGWKVANNDELQEILKYKRTMRSKPGQLFTMSAGGARTRNPENYIASECTSIVIEERFKQVNCSTDNNCVWLGVASMLNYHDGVSGDKMLAPMKKDPEKFDWLYLRKSSRRKDCVVQHDKKNAEFLHVLIRQYSDYNLVSIDRNRNSIDGNCFMEYLLRDDTQGMYVALLQDFNGSMLHCISINCSRKLIFDCMNDYVMKLTLKSLHYCVGIFGGGLDRIGVCYEIKPKDFQN